MELKLWQRIITHHGYSALLSVIISLSGVYQLYNIYIHLPDLYNSIVYL